MSHREKIIQYMDRFCAGDVEGPEPLLAPDLRFEGPLHLCHSRSEHLDALRMDSPEQCGAPGD